MIVAVNAVIVSDRRSEVLRHLAYPANRHQESITGTPLILLTVLPRVRIICGTADRGTAEPTEPKRNDCFITTTFS